MASSPSTSLPAATATRMSPTSDKKMASSRMERAARSASGAQRWAPLRNRLFADELPSRVHGIPSHPQDASSTGVHRTLHGNRGSVTTVKFLSAGNSDNSQERLGLVSGDTTGRVVIWRAATPGTDDVGCADTGNSCMTQKSGPADTLNPGSSKNKRR